MKQPNWKTPLILSATLLTVGTFAYWLQYSHKPKKDQGNLLLKKPIALSKDDEQIVLLKIKSSQGLIELKCESIAEKKCSLGSLGKWTITNPHGPNGELYQADPSVVKEYLNTAANSIATEVIDLSEDTPEKRKSLLGEYGLNDEQRTKIETQFVEVIVADEKGNPGKRLTAWFGADHPIGDKSFVASSVDGTINDKVIFLISQQTKNANFTKNLTNFRDKTLFTFDRKNITEFTAQVVAEKRNGGKLIGQKKDSLWTINGYPTNYEHIETVLSAIANAKAIEFVDASLIKGLKPIVSYSLKAGEKNYSLMIYEKTLPEKKVGNEKLPAEKHYYAQSSEKKDIVEVESILRSNIDKGLIDLRNTLLFSETEKVTSTRVKVEGAGFSSPIEFNYVKSNWAAQDTSKNWDPAIAKRIIDLFAMTRIKDFVSPPPTGKELFKVSIGDEKNPTKFHFSIFSVKEQLYARNLNEKTSEAYLMEESMKLALPKTENEWKIKPTSK
jgi:hypothetical protein